MVKEAMMKTIDDLMYELELELDDDAHEAELDHEDDELMFQSTQHETDQYRVPLDAAVRLMSKGYIIESDTEY